MKTGIFYKQMGRSLRTLLINGVILLAVTAFFAMSLNLYSNSTQNLTKAGETYSTIAVMELYGDVDLTGNLTDPNEEEHRGWRSVSVDDYDLTPIVSARGVLDYDLRARYAAYIEGTPAASNRNDVTVEEINFMEGEHLIRFRLERDTPVSIPISWSEDYYAYSRNFPNPVYLDILDISSDFLWYKGTDFHSDGINMGHEEEREYYAEQVKKLNRTEEIDHVILYPGVEYIASNVISRIWRTDEDDPSMLFGARWFAPGHMNYFTEDHRVYYQTNKEGIRKKGYMQADQPFPIARWEDVQADPQLKAQWDAAWQAAEYNMCTYQVCLTDNIAGVPAFHLGGAFLSDGRMITKAEYESGAKVCMISQQMAELQHWRVGDKLDMDLYRFEAIPNTDADLDFCNPVYHKNTQGFFDSGEYEIVGIYEKKPLAGNSGISKTTLSMPWNLIYLPHNSVDNALPEEERPVHGALLTIWLDNDSVDEFLTDMDVLGLTQPKPGQFNPVFTFYDQGYSMIQASLQSMHSASRLLVMLSALLLVITCVLLAWFFAQNQKHSIGIFRMLGGKKHQAAAAVLVCALVITLLSAGLGALLGNALSQQVARSMLAGSEEDQLIAGLRANVLTTNTEAMDLATAAKPELSALAGAAALLFPLMMMVFVFGYIHQEPRELLPKNKA